MKSAPTHVTCAWLLSLSLSLSLSLCCFETLQVQDRWHLDKIHLSKQKAQSVHSQAFTISRSRRHVWHGAAIHLKHGLQLRPFALDFLSICKSVLFVDKRSMTGVTGWNETVSVVEGLRVYLEWPVCGFSMDAPPFLQKLEVSDWLRFRAIYLRSLDWQSEGNCLIHMNPRIYHFGMTVYLTHSTLKQLSYYSTLM